jgi:hypothetical protein
MDDPDCNNCEISAKGEAIFYAGAFVGVLMSFIFFFVFLGDKCG